MHGMPFLPNLHGSKIRVFLDSFFGGCYDFQDRMSETWDLARSDISHVISHSDISYVISHSDISYVQSLTIRRLRRPISRFDTDPYQKDVGWM